MFNESTFSPTGWATIKGGNTLDAVVRRNTPKSAVDGPVTMTQGGWKRKR